MNDYDFRPLDDKEFEGFCVDVIGSFLGVRIERFKRGRDGGVDGRFFRSDGEEVVLQCKHWPSTPFEALVRRLAKEELPKIARLAPRRYLIAVSNPLSRKDKESIQGALSPYIATPADIFGREDLNAILAEFPAIERRHYKLWLSSTAVLTHILNKPILDRSAFSIEETIDATKRYVITSNHQTAMEKLEKLRVLVIAGEPGIGKTTLAEHLCLHYVANEFEFFRIANEISEAEAVFEAKKRQIFYFDDFLGRNYLSAISGHEGNHIVQFIRRVSKDPAKRFVLTSRSTILNQGKVLMDTFDHEGTERNEFILTVTSLKAVDRARILYSHMWHSDLAPEFIDELYKNKRYKLIVGHKNFNPRLISFITSANRFQSHAPDSYWQHVAETLKNPAGVWENPFVAQQDDFGRALVLLVVMNGERIAESDLAETFSRFVSRADNHAMQGKRDLMTNLRYLTGSLLRRTLDVNAAKSITSFIDLFNPSLGDYVVRRYASDRPSLRSAFKSLRSVSSINTLLSLRKNKLVDDEGCRELLCEILKEARENAYSGYGSEFLALAGVNLFTEDGGFTAEVESLLVATARFVASAPVPNRFFEVALLVQWARSFEVVTLDRLCAFVDQAVSKSPAQDEFRLLLELLRECNQLDPQVGSRIARINQQCIESLRSNIEVEIDQRSVFEGVEYEDHEGARSNLESLIAEWLDEAGADYSEADVQSISVFYEIEERMKEHVRDEPYEHEFGHRTLYVTPVDEIDDVFDRQ